MGVITIKELEVCYRVGVPDEERAVPQRLLLNLRLERDFVQAAATDDLTHTVDYFAVCQRLLRFGDGRAWKLIEKLASDIADELTHNYSVDAVEVEVQKFIIPETRYVSVFVRKDGSRFT